MLSIKKFNIWMISSCLYLLLAFQWPLTKQYLYLPASRYWYLCSPFFFENQRWINSLILDFTSVCVMVVYKVEKSNALMLLQIYWDLEQVSNRSFEFVNIHIWLTPLLEKQVSVKSVRYVRYKSLKKMKTFHFA